MMYKQISIKQALRKVSADLGFTASNASEFPWQDAVEWIGEALGQIGAYSQYNVKERDLTIADYKTKLPCDLIEIKQIIDVTSGFKLTSNRTLIENLDPDDTKFYANTETDYDFNIVMDNLITSFKDGTIRIQYLAMPTDEEGFPMVPDSESYKEAMFWKVARQLAIRNANPNKELDFGKCDRQWQWYCGQARAEANAMNFAEKEFFNWNYHSMVPLRKTVSDAVVSRAIDSFSTWQ